jgi:hypothetical protein
MIGYRPFSERDRWQERNRSAHKGRPVLLVLTIAPCGSVLKGITIFSRQVGIGVGWWELVSVHFFPAGKNELTPILLDKGSCLSSAGLLLPAFPQLTAEVDQALPHLRILDPLHHRARWRRILLGRTIRCRCSAGGKGASRRHRDCGAVRAHRNRGCQTPTVWREVARLPPFGERNSNCRQSLGVWVSGTPV